LNAEDKKALIAFLKTLQLGRGAWPRVPTW
jgi:hypothetical protein